jgi:transposase
MALNLYPSGSPIALTFNTGKSGRSPSSTIKSPGQLESRLVVEIKPGQSQGSGRVAIDLGETILMTCAFNDGTVSLYSGRKIKSIRRYWQKVRANLEQGSRRWFQIAHKERKQVDQLLHIATSHFISECVKKGVKEVAIGDLKGIRDNMDSTVTS